MVNGLIGLFAAYSGISIGMMLMPYNGFVALLCGMFAGGTADLLFTYISNALFTAREEKQADLFAAKHSSKEEILAAADFFEKHQMIVDQAKRNAGILGKIPSVILNGHHDGFARAAILRNSVHNQ
jgi:hypothetical protein